MAKTKAQVARRGRAAHRVDPEQFNRLLLVGGVVAVILVAVGIIAFGWYQTQIKPASKTVLEVGESKFTLGYLEKRMELQLKDRPDYGATQQGALLLIDNTMLQLEREGKLIEAAAQLNVPVTEEDVDNEIKERGSLAPDAEASAFAAELRRQVADSGLKLGEFRQKVKAELLEEKVSNYFLYVAPTTEPQAHVRWIVVADVAEGEQVLDRLNAGEDFAAVAKEVSQDTTTGELGGEREGFWPRGAFPTEEMEDFLFDAQPGQRSEVIDTPLGAYIVELLQRDETLALSEQGRQIVSAREMNAWLSRLDGQIHIEQHLTDDDRRYALENVF